MNKTMAGMVARARRRTGSKRKGKWETIKLREILGNPEFVGKTARIGDCIFEVKGIDNLLVLKNETMNTEKISADFAA